MSETKKFPKTYLTRELRLPRDAGKYADVEVIENTLVDTGRWSLVYRLIFRLPDQPAGEAWRVHYEVGATESQDIRPWEYDGDEIDAALVCAVEKTVIAWEPKP